MIDIIKYIVANINRNVPNIDQGGCGIFSYYLHNTLKKYNIDSEIVYICGGKQNKYNIPFTHILLKIDNYVIDNNGVFDYTTSHNSLDINILKKLIDNKELWNRAFYRGWTDSNFEYVNPEEKLIEEINFSVEENIKNIIL